MFSAKRFKADVEKCVNGNGDWVTKGDRLRDLDETMAARMNAHLAEEAVGKHKCMVYIGRSSSASQN